METGKRHSKGFLQPPRVILRQNLDDSSQNMSENVRTRLRKRKQSEYIERKDEKCQKKSRVTDTNVANTSSETDPMIEVNEKMQNETGGFSSTESSSSAEKNESVKTQGFNTDSDDTREYENSSNQHGETKEQKCVRDEEKDRRDFGGLFRKDNGNCELLSKLLNDTSDQSCHAIEWKSSSVKRSSSEHRCDQVFCEGDHASKQHLISNTILDMKVQKISLKTFWPLHTWTVSRCCDQSDTSLNENNAVENNNSNSTAAAVQRAKGNEDNRSFIAQVNSPRIKAAKRDNPHLIELITQVDSPSEDSDGTSARSQFCNNDSDSTQEMTVTKYEMKGGRAGEKKNNVEDLVSGTKKDDCCNNVSVGDRDIKRDGIEDVGTKKTSIRLRRRSGDTWAVKYEKDFVLTPLAKLSKGDATFLPPKGIDATIISEEKLCRGLRQKYDRTETDTLFGDEDFPSCSYSSDARKTGVQCKRRKHKRKYSSKHNSTRIVETTGDELPVAWLGAVALPSGEAVVFPSTSTPRDEHRAASQTKESRRSTRSTPLLENKSGVVTRRQRENGIELLSDSRLSRHACALWSSENRRHFQLTHPSASGEALDNLMRSAWEQLGNKEKLKYVHRAKNAMKDRNKHSYHASASHAKKTDRPRTENNNNNKPCQEDKFDTLPSDHQHAILKNKLKYFQNVLSSGEYRRFLQDYKASFRSTAENVRVSWEQFKFKGITSHLESLSRKMLYSKVKDYEPRVEERRRQRFIQLKKECDRRFQNLVMDILNDEIVWNKEYGDDNDDTNDDRMPAAFNARGPSDELGWVLETLKTIQYDDQTDWSEKDKENINLLAQHLSMVSNTNTVPPLIENQFVKLPIIENQLFEATLLNEASVTEVLPELSVDDVKDVITHAFKVEVAMPTIKVKTCELNRNSAEDPDQKVNSLPFLRPRAAPPPHPTFHDYALTSSTYRDENGQEQCCELDSPSCMLTAALVSDRLKQQHMAKR